MPFGIKIFFSELYSLSIKSKLISINPSEYEMAFVILEELAYFMHFSKKVIFLNQR